MSATTTNPAVIFGDFVRQIRLAKRIMGRSAATAAEMLPSNFSKLEHGILLPSQDSEKQKKLLSAIGIQPDTAEATEFFDLAAAATKSTPIDLAQIISENETIPLLLRTIGNKRLSEDEIKRLVAIVHGKSSYSES